MTAEFAAEVILPELGKPDIPSVVLQRSADEVTIKPWTDAAGGGGGFAVIDTVHANSRAGFALTPPTVRA